MKKLWSVIVPNFNNGKYLDELLSPFLEISENSQSKMEIIISDDKSTDNSLEVIQKYIDINPDMYKVYKSNKNSHHGGALNKGMSIATGEWFTFLDGDDRYNVEGIQKTIKALEQADDDVNAFTTDVHVFYEQSKKPIFEDIIYILHNKDCLYFNTFTIHNHIVRTSLCKDMKIPEGVAYDDFYSTAYILTHIRNVQNRRDIDLFEYRLNRKGQSVSSVLTNSVEVIQGNIYLFDESRKNLGEDFKFLFPNIVPFIYSLKNMGATNNILDNPNQLYIFISANIPNKFNVNYFEFSKWFINVWRHYYNPILDKTDNIKGLGGDFIEF